MKDQRAGVSSNSNRQQVAAGSGRQQQAAGGKQAAGSGQQAAAALHKVQCSGPCDVTCLLEDGLKVSHLGGEDLGLLVLDLELLERGLVECLLVLGRLRLGLGLEGGGVRRAGEGV